MSLPLRPLSIDSNTRQLDSKQKKYHQTVEKALQHFDSVTEWADYISSLGKLLKALQSWSPKFQNVKYYVPFPYQVARRLASSLSPNLPSGVHQKTLEVYSFIFEKIGSETLSKEINIWIGGILPLMSYASISVKAPLIELYESYIVTLPSETLTILIKPLLASLFPGIDDESSEFQPTVMALMENLYSKLNNASLFWQSCFIVIINNKDRRLGALVWLTKKIPSLNAVPHLVAKAKDIDLSGMDDKAMKEHALSLLLESSRDVISPEPGLLVRSFVKCLEDDNEILIQRGILDLLLQRLHLHSPLLQYLVKPADCKLLIMSACKTMLKRDMSLNRRIWNWLLGPTLDPETGDHNDSEYFLKNGSKNLLDGLNEMLDEPRSCVEAFRIVSALMDRWQIGSYLTPTIFIPLIEKSRAFNENSAVMKTASFFFDSVETNIIWGKLFEKVFVLHDYDLLKYVLQHFNCSTDEEIIVHHLPLMLLSLLSRERSDIPYFFVLLETLISMIPERAYLPIQHSKLSHKSNVDYANVFDQIRSHYVVVSDPIKSKDMESSTELRLPFNTADLTFLIMYRMHKLLIDSIHDYQNIREYSKMFVQLIEIVPEELASSENPPASNWSDTELIQSLFDLKNSIEVTPNESMYGIVDIYTKYLLKNLPILDSLRLLKIFMRGLWLLLMDSDSQADAVKILNTLLRYVPTSQIESCLSVLFINEKDISYRMSVLDCLWNNLGDNIAVIKRPLSLAFDELSDEKNAYYWFVNKWLSSIVVTESSNKLFNLLMENILQFDFINAEKINSHDDLPLFTYHLEVLKNILKSPDTQVYTAFCVQITKLDSLHHWKNEDVSTYKNLTTAIILKFLSMENKTPGNSIKSALSLLSLLVNGTESNFSDIVTKLLQISTQYIINQVESSQSIVVSLLNIISQVLALSHKEQTKLDIFAEDNSDIKYIDFLVTTIQNVDDELVLASYERLLSESIIYFQQSILQIILPLSASICDCVVRIFGKKTKRNSSFKSICSLLLCLEEILEVSHSYLRAEESTGYFSHSGGRNDFLQNMVSNVFSSDNSSFESRLQNERTIVLKSFKTVLEVTLDVWNWADETSIVDTAMPATMSGLLRKSSHEISVKYKVAANRMIEKLFSLEPLDVLETIIAKDGNNQAIKLNFSLDNGKYNVTISHLLQSVIIRCNENTSLSLFSSGKPKKLHNAVGSNSLNSGDILLYLFKYIQFLSNAAVEDFYNDFMIFIKEVLSNYSSYASNSFLLLKLIVLVSEKIDYSSLGQERRIRRDISESFVKLLGNSMSADIHDTAKQEEIISSLLFIIEKLSYAVNERNQGDRFNSSLNSIVAYAILPFSQSLDSLPPSILEMIKIIAPIGERVKNFKQVLSELFSDSKYLSKVLNTDSKTWNFIFFEWSQYSDNKERLLPELVLSVTSKSTVITPSINPFNAWSESELISKFNGIIKIAYLLLISPKDHYFIHCQSLLNMVEQHLFGDESLLQAASFLLLRALLLQFSYTHFVDHWSMLFSGLQATLLGVYESIQIQQPVNNKVILQIVKTLDLLLTLNVEEFSATNEWIFVIDSINSIYKKGPYVALADEISQCKNFSMGTGAVITLKESETSRVPMLYGIHHIDNFTDLGPFFFNVSYTHYEAMYNMRIVDEECCCNDLLEDIFHQLK